MGRTKHIGAAERLLSRIRNGDYHLGGIPAERDLAEEIGVSRMTARKAVLRLINRGHLFRLPNGRIEIKNRMALPQFALLASAHPSGETDEWNIALSKLSRKYKFLFKSVYYYHNDDPVIKNTVASFDCTFMLPPAPTDNLVKELKRTGKPFFILNSDWSSFGIPSILIFPPVFVKKMLDHLSSLGHRRIDCLNVQPDSGVISERISIWKEWLEERGYNGNLINEPVKSYSDPYPAAFKLIDKLIRRKKFDSKALFCITEPAAFAGMCAMIDHGIIPGKDIAVCVAGTAAKQESFRPSLTSMEKVEIEPYLHKCISWMMKKQRKWKGPLLMKPDNIEVAVRQSTVPEKKGNL